MQKFTMLFPGQGAQYIGMGKNLYDEYNIAKRTFDEAEDIVGFPLKKLCFEGGEEELTLTENAQVAILTSGIAAFLVFQEKYGIEPVMSAGHSLGEITALTCSGAIRFKDAVKIVRKRGQFMQEAANAGVMYAIQNIDKQEIEDMCNEAAVNNRIVVISNYNSPKQYVISGYADATDEIADKLGELGAKINKLKISAPFHSPILQGASDRFKEELSKYTFNMPKWTVMSNATAQPYSSKGDIIEFLSKQIVFPVRWEEIMRHIKEAETDVVIDLGPKNVCRNLAGQNGFIGQNLAFDNPKDFQEIEQLVEKIRTNKKMTVVTRCMAVAVCTKNQNWDENEYRQGVVEPYRKIKALQERLDQEDSYPTIEQMKEALDMLKSVFRTKHTPESEQMNRFQQILNETGTRNLLNNYVLSIN